MNRYPGVINWAGICALLMVIALFAFPLTLSAQNQKVEAEVVNEARWDIMEGDPLAKADRLYTLLSPDHKKLLIAYITIENYKVIKCHIRILSINGKSKQKDFVLPTGYTTCKAEWAPDGQKMLLLGWKDNALNTRALVLDLDKGVLCEIPHIFQFWYPVRLVSIGSVFNPASNALVLPKESKDGRAYLIISDFQGKTKKLIANKEVERFFAPPGIVYVGWDRQGNALWLGKENVGVFKISFPTGAKEKVYDFPTLQGYATLWVLIEPYSGKLFLWAERVTKGGKPPKEAQCRLAVMDLKTGEKIYEDRITYSFPAGGYTWPHSKYSGNGKAVWFWCGYSKVPFRLWLFEGNKVKKLSFKLPIPRKEEIADIQWENGMLYVATYNWKISLRKKPLQKTVKLYQIAVSFPR